MSLKFIMNSNTIIIYSALFFTFLINPPLFDEIAVKHLYDDVSQQPLIKDYFPDTFTKGCQCDRAYFYNVWNTKYPEQVKETIDYANAQRYTVSNEDARQNAIVVSDDWLQEIDSMPFVSKQKGRMTALLKAKSKIKIERKPRVQYPVGESLKRLRDPPKSTATNTGKPPANTIPLNSGTISTNTSTMGQSIFGANLSQAQTQAQTQSQPKKIQPKILEKFDVQMKDK